MLEKQTYFTKGSAQWKTDSTFKLDLAITTGSLTAYTFETLPQ